MMAAICAEADLVSPEQELKRLREANPLLVMQLVVLKKPNASAVEMIAAQTIRARGSRCMLAERAEVDLLLRLAGSDQISEAIARVGYVRRGKKTLVAAGDPTAIRRLRRALSADHRYRLLLPSRIDHEALMAVEKAALLGASR